MNLNLEHRPAGSTNPAVQRCRHPFDDGVEDPLLHVLDSAAGVAFVPSSVEVTGAERLGCRVGPPARPRRASPAAADQRTGRRQKYADLPRSQPPLK